MYLLDFIKNNENWEELLTQKPYCLKISRDDGYIMFKYNQIDSNFNLPEVREARGIIFREADWKPVCVPFYKFGNAGESYCPEIKWEYASVQTKIDGSLIKMWYDNNKWHISTNGTIDAGKAPLESGYFHTYLDVFRATLPNNFETITSIMKKNYTYMFELVSPFTRVVIPYNSTKLYFLGLRNNDTLKEEYPDNNGLLFFFEIPKRYSLTSLEAVKNAANNLPWDEEGYVVCDNEFNRVKIKSPAYVQAHYLRTNGCITEERLLEIIRTNEKNEFLIYASDFKDMLENLEAEYNKMIKEIKAKLKKIKPEMYETRKEFAEAVKKQPKWMQGFLFKATDIKEQLKNTTTAKLMELIENRRNTK